MKIIKVPKFKYDAKTLLKWLWRSWRGNRLQATLNAVVGLLSVAVSLGQVWAVKHAIDVASHAVQGNIYWAVALMGGLILCDFALNISGIWIRNLERPGAFPQRLLLSLLHGQALVGSHRRYDSHLPGFQQGVYGQDAIPDPSGARYRQ